MPPRCIGIEWTLKPFCISKLGSAFPNSPYPINTSNPFAIDASAIGNRCDTKKLKSFTRIKSLITHSFNLYFFSS